MGRQRVGSEPARLLTLPALFAELAALGCHDVSLLRYVGGDPRLQLDDNEHEQLAALIADAPLSCRMSVCFGDTVPQRSCLMAPTTRVTAGRVTIF